MSSALTASRTPPEAVEGFRSQVRSWLAAHVPAGWKETLAGAPIEEYIAFQHWWLGEMRSAGFDVAHWPAAHGGGRSVAEQAVLCQELAAAGAPDLRLFTVSLHHAATTILAHGSEEHQRHLEAIRHGEIWCQGFSEPDAGSDLANLRTRADRRDDDYVINGTKIWSSNAAYADMCLLLARTDPNVAARAGLSFFLMDMRTAGVTVRPIEQINGDREFCEIFFTDAKVPLAQRLGEEGDGWAIAQTTLSTERGPALLELQARLRHDLDRLVVLAVESGVDHDHHIRQQIVGRYEEVEILRLLIERMLKSVDETGRAGVESSIIKLYYSDLLQRLTALGVEIDGLRTQLVPPALTSREWASGHWLMDHISSWGWTIAGGTNQIQRNLIGERVLGLPKEPRA